MTIKLQLIIIDSLLILGCKPNNYIYKVFSIALQGPHYGPNNLIDAPGYY